MKHYNRISDDDLREVVKIEKLTRTGEYICDCVFCGKPSHLYISKATQQFDCKKCGESGGIYKLLRHVDKLYLLGQPTIQKVESLQSIRVIAEEDEKNSMVIIPELPDVKMPAGYRIHPPSEYLRSRGINYKDCQRYGIGYTNVSYKFKNYILIPIFDDNKIKGYIARWGSKKVPDGKLRYKNSLNTDFASLLFGYDDIIEGETESVIIVEGVFDLIAVNKYLQLDSEPSLKCVCTFGKKISDVQIQKLMNKGIRNVILSYDFDALKEIRQYGLELNKYFNTYVAVSTNKKDIDECTVDEAIKVFENMKPIKNFRTDVIAKIKR